MAIEIVKTFVVKAPPARVWGFLTDAERVARCMPGAAITDRIDERTFAGTMAVKVGPVSTSYKGKIVFERVDAGARTAEIVASGQDVGGRGGADLRLTSSIKEIAPGETEVTAASKVNITGILAQMGRGMVQDVSDQIFQTFSQRMRAELEPPAASGAIAGPPSSAAARTDGAPAPAARTEPLDLAPLGGRVAGRAASRALRRPAFWVAAIAAGALLYLLFR
jgi:uncharacterized protein